MCIRDRPELLRSAVKSAAPLCFLLAFATAFGRTLSLIHAADIVQNAIMTIATDKISFLIVVIIAFFLLGMVMDTGPALIILGPILCPIAESYGIDPVHLGVLMVCNLAVGLVTPPFGLNLFVTSSISGEQPMTIDGYKRQIPDRGDEVTQLAHSFDDLSQRLSRAFLMQRSFSQNAAHEFRTPLAVLKTRIGLFRKKQDFAPQTTEAFLSIMESEVDRLSGMVDSLLKLTNLEPVSYTHLALGNDPIQTKVGQGYRLMEKEAL